MFNYGKYMRNFSVINRFEIFDIEWNDFTNSTSERILAKLCIKYTEKYSTVDL